jgi:hypothetical protein
MRLSSAGQSIIKGIERGPFHFLVFADGARFTPRHNGCGFDPLTVRSCNVQDFDVGLSHTITRRLQSSLLRIVLLEPVHRRLHAVVAGVPFPRHRRCVPLSLDFVSRRGGLGWRGPASAFTG